MLDILADGVTERVEEHLTTDEDQEAERDMAEWPTVFERIHDQ